ncbi:hypothetical protein Slin_5370 [Spirosoma linguale DSM 74]|uniref:Uncharacterized protein n=1 Tax=Spirosoma linguale (strain ATCC 33905 / DSM 74 / LMG 10896 / Claus 1) TaxID=504472 RepID=D2QEZ4_SPILD|nr:hypothetical protein Slin_5370 [Spirosoma linguale DSM 74]
MSKPVVANATVNTNLPFERVEKTVSLHGLYKQFAIG